ncbi:conserved hypothetical protein [Desulfamplus magnetovallimortis]|uniref:Prepilin-type N-terminal cleavage/methylation domain-containing protein n=1 Tax=Desulfamplus magnetovallimortis TaxID=1246637 RepID=A0A1W1HIA9_9BACT|nr:PilW family protein [Desulfamplus magnetovallimortis]SLM32186.1 conserved hypothetical protein [Desulfamplus magnetovallimortis]
MDSNIKKSAIAGFTLIEILISLAISGILMSGVYVSYLSQNKSYETQQRVIEMQQNLRNAMYHITRDIRMAGFNPTGSAAVAGITYVDFEDLDGNLDDTDGYAYDDLTAFSTLTFIRDDSEDGIVDSGETIIYGLYDYPVSSPNTIVDLYKDEGAGRQLLAQGIEAIGFAYAFDSDPVDTDGDGATDTYGNGSIDMDASNNIIWAIDSDNDQFLDKALDTDADGDIDMSDTPGGIAINSVTTYDLTEIGNKVDIKRIMAVKIWILAKAIKKTEGYSCSGQTYVVGNKRVAPVPPDDDEYMRRLMVNTVMCRNAAL